MLPCPCCAASVRASNLDKHLTQQHGSGVSAPAASTLTGIDRTLERQLVIVLFVLLAIGITVVSVTAMKLTDANVTVAVAVVLALLTSVVMASAGKFSARLVFDGGRVRLHYGLGLRTRTLSKVERIELGRARTTQPRAGMQQHEHAELEVDGGMYLRLVDGKRRITVGCRKGTGFRTHWSSSHSSSGKATRSLDIALGREAMVAFEYELAEIGLLVVRER